jgi:hypothetical protein
MPNLWSWSVKTVAVPALRIGPWSADCRRTMQNGEFSAHKHGWRIVSTLHCVRPADTRQHRTVFFYGASGAVTGCVNCNRKFARSNAGTARGLKTVTLVVGRARNFVIKSGDLISSGGARIWELGIPNFKNYTIQTMLGVSTQHSLRPVSDAPCYNSVK